MRPRVTARSAMSGASWWAGEGAAQNTGDDKRVAGSASSVWPTRFGGRVAAIGSRFPPSDPFARLKHERMTRFTPARSSPRSIALRPRVAARSPMSGASWPGDGCGRGAAGLPAGSRKTICIGTSLHAGVLSAALRCAAPARCGALADTRRVGAGDGGGRGRTRNDHRAPRISKSSGAVPTCHHQRAIALRVVSHRRACTSLVASFTARVPVREAELATPSSHRRAHRFFHCAARARGDAFADERRLVAGDEGGWITLPRSRRCRGRSVVERWAEATRLLFFAPGAPIAILRFAAPARGGGSVDERRIVAATK
jgi:hypothetical protein